MLSYLVFVHRPVSNFFLSLPRYFVSSPSGAAAAASTLQSAVSNILSNNDREKCPVTEFKNDGEREKNRGGCCLRMNSR